MTTTPAVGEALAPIERDESFDRTYIPLPGGWEVQTKGRGSTFRIAEADGTQLPIPDSPYLHETLERMAREVHAHIADLEARLASYAETVSLERAAREVAEARAAASEADAALLHKAFTQWRRFGGIEVGLAATIDAMRTTRE